MRLFKFVCREGESLVYFDHMLDVFGCGYHLAVDFIHAHALLVMRWTRVRGQNRPLNIITTSNHIQHVIKIYQALPLLIRKLEKLHKGESLVMRLHMLYIYMQYGLINSPSHESIRHKYMYMCMVQLSCMTVQRPRQFEM